VGEIELVRNASDAEYRLDRDREEEAGFEDERDRLENVGQHLALGAQAALLVDDEELRDDTYWNSPDIAES
jgi:hypothetical protein